MLDGIAINNPERVALVEWHTSSSYPLHTPEARSKWFSYSPPYWYNGNWYYATPWAWIDGKQRGYSSSMWQTYVNQQLAVPADVGINLSGNYVPGAGTGQLQVEFVNSTASPITATCHIVITEDSIYYQAPNGDQWHNQVCRDYVPTHVGISVTVPAGGTDTLVQDFTVQSGWDESRCKVIAYLQNHTMQADSSEPIYQGGKIPLLALTGVAEERPLARPTPANVSVVPNPVGDRAEFRFAGTPGEPYELTIHSLDGRLVDARRGTVAASTGIVRWDRRDDEGTRVARGVYAYRLRTGSSLPATGKFVVLD